MYRQQLLIAEPIATAATAASSPTGAAAGGGKRRRMRGGEAVAWTQLVAIPLIIHGRKDENVENEQRGSDSDRHAQRRRIGGEAVAAAAARTAGR